MNHPNIVKLKEVIRENDILYFIMEYMVLKDVIYRKSLISSVSLLLSLPCSSRSAISTNL